MEPNVYLGLLGVGPLLLQISSKMSPAETLENPRFWKGLGSETFAFMSWRCPPGILLSSAIAEP